jgi:hypothetical protein
MVGGSLQVLRLPPPLKLVAMILLKVALNTINQSRRRDASLTFLAVSKVVFRQLFI